MSITLSDSNLEMFYKILNLNLFFSVVVDAASRSAIP